MIPAPFEYVRAGSVEEAVAALTADPDAKLLAGGHSLLPAMRLRLVRVSTLVDIGRLTDLSYVREDGDAIAIGALTRHHDVANSEALQSGCPIVAYAASQIGDPAVRHVGTIGGSVAHGDPAGDLPAVLLALDASFVITGAGGATRTVEATSFFTGLFEHGAGAQRAADRDPRPEDERRVELPEVQPSRTGLGAGRCVGGRVERRRPRGPHEHGAHAVARNRGRGRRRGRRRSRRRGRTRR